MTEGIETTNIIELVVEVVASYISNNEIAITEIPELIQQVHRSLCNLRTGRSYLLHERSEPAVLIEDSIHPDYIVCLEDGRRLKMLKRHLRTAYNMTPEQYRERWSLPRDYPMVAPNYAKCRSNLAKNIGLGTRREKKRNLAA
ncbi:MAG: transcriptional regulatory protein [uncultured bacterium]|nr:MAG: transcriptional regulatory protein [uncultured bacterium]OFW67973.1 MAG: MucR family transcriptional regulator [Alphaproteobacteria bacterium GWC2_42_16]OFW74675.1 MAG: MucR family transcriptional regulator [Alphaproteobacteria bacterium GWA2_41_27]OFW84980.1 MAG: MucR family transcriptional regulator [Alphaproteobacteria bacterium RIFCSPHIGHO2_12_FULL_42_100]OFW85553.1 MAG: MucR family transcriptional regulator [Alphaproteobacteria bacterium RBG_16_42_14]OFW91124.1 MAG: MucR family tr